MASRAGGARVGISSLDLLSAAVEHARHAEGEMAELATARVAYDPSSGGLRTSRRGDPGGDDGPNDSAGEWSDGESFDSDEDEIDVEEVVRVVTRMAKEGPTITVVPVDRKHHDVNDLTRLLPRVEGPAVIPKGTIRGLSQPVRLSLDSKGMLAHWSGIRLKAPAQKGDRAPRPPNKRPTTVKEREMRAQKAREKRAANAKKRKLAGDAGAGASGSKRANTQTHPESFGRQWRTRGVATSKNAADASEMVANGENRTSDDDIALELHGRQLLWAQHIAATSGPQRSENSEKNDDDAEPEPSPQDYKDITTMEPPESVGKSKAKTPTVEKDGGYVRLTVDWRARTRVRSNLQPPKVHTVKVEVLPGELCAQFISRMVQLPPGAAYRDTQLSWGSFTIPPLQSMHHLRLGSWVFDTRAANPPEAVLSVPVGTVLTHPALVEAAGPNYVGMISGLSADIAAAPASEHAVARRRLPDPNDDRFLAEWAGDVFTSEPMVKGRVDGLSNRALHPGRTDPECMAKILRERGVVKEDETCTIVDVGSGDGNFVRGLQRAFPRACLCGIECQPDLFEESVQLCGRDANFMLGTAEKMLHRCQAASVIISTTHNFDASTVMNMVHTAARLPMAKYLVVGEPRLCTPRCKAVYGPCCCFEPIATEDVTTLWGNRSLPFVIYRRVVPWLLEANSAPRITDEATIAALRSGELDPYALAQSTFMGLEGAGTRPSAADKTEVEPMRRTKRQTAAAAKDEEAPKLGLINQFMKFAGVLPRGKEAAMGRE